MLQQFTRNTSTPAAIEATFEMSPAAFDKEFDAFVRARFATLLASIDEWQRVYQAARRAIDEERWADAIEPARRAAQLYPEHVGPGSPNLLLARALDNQSRREEAIAALETYRGAGGWDPQALRELAGWLDAAGRSADATTILRSLNYAEPLDPQLHAQLGERLLEAGNAEASLQEFRAVQALDQHDPAPALYGAARALQALGDREASRRSVLDALAIAPHYKPAQAFLLQMIEERNQNE